MNKIHCKDQEDSEEKIALIINKTFLVHNKLILLIITEHYIVHIYRGIMYIFSLEF